MIKKYLLLAFLPFVVQAQNDVSNSFSNTESFGAVYQADSLYWKNRKPNAAYWQQDVSYNIKAKLIDSVNVVSGDETLTYYNNSPDELPFVFFHLYSNAQTKGSYMSDLYKNNGVKLRYGRYRNAGLGTDVESIAINGQA